MKFIPELSGESADQRHVNNRSRLVLAPGANYYNGCQTSNVWQRNMSRLRGSRPRGSRKQQTKITFAARARTLNRFKKKLSWGTGIRSLSSFSLGFSHCAGVRLKLIFFITIAGFFTGRHQNSD